MKALKSPVLLLASFNTVFQATCGWPQPLSAQPKFAVPALARADELRIRSDIRNVERLQPNIPDRGAVLFLLAKRYTQLGELPKALSLLRECLSRNQGFDPVGIPAFLPLQRYPEFRDLVIDLRRRQPAVHRAHVAFTIPQNDLFPEGLVADFGKLGFYMGSMYHKKIVHISETGYVSDFVKAGFYNLGPVGGLHLDPADHGVWAAADPLDGHPSELLHFDSNGTLIERFAAPGPGPHDLNDLVLRGTREIYITDTEGNKAYRFNRTSRRFATLRFPRPLRYPNGITVSGDANSLYVADMLGVIRVDLRTNAASEVLPGPGSTLCGIDGLYWYKGSLVGVQYGAGAYRVARWRLAPDGLTVASTEVLEYRSALVSDPTTGTIVGDRFYFMANTGIDNLRGDTIVDANKLEPLQIACVSLSEK